MFELEQPKTLVLGRTASTCTVKFRIGKVSRRKDGQRYAVLVEVDDTRFRGRAPFLGAYTTPINVLSKRKTGERMVSRPPHAVVAVGADSGGGAVKFLHGTILQMQKTLDEVKALVKQQGKKISAMDATLRGGGGGDAISLAAHSGLMPNASPTLYPLMPPVFHPGPDKVPSGTLASSSSEGRRASRTSSSAAAAAAVAAAPPAGAAGARGGVRGTTAAGAASAPPPGGSGGGGIVVGGGGSSRLLGADGLPLASPTLLFTLSGMPLEDMPPDMSKLLPESGVKRLRSTQMEVAYDDAGQVTATTTTTTTAASASGGAGGTSLPPPPSMPPQMNRNLSRMLSAGQVSDFLANLDQAHSEDFPYLVAPAPPAEKRARVTALGVDFADGSTVSGMYTDDPALAARAAAAAAAAAPASAPPPPPPAR